MKYAIRRSESGFSLVEVMMAGGIMAVLSTGFMGMSANMAKMQRNTENKVASLSQGTLAKAVLMDETACTRSFGNLNPSSNLRGLTIRSSNGSAFLKTGDMITGQNAKISDIVLSADSTSPDTFARVTVSFSRIAETTPLKPTEIKLSIKKTPGGVIEKCAANGIPDPKMNFANITCGNGEYLEGFDSVGDKKCVEARRSVANLSCGSGQYIQGFNSSGSPMCQSVPAPSAPPATPPPSSCGGSSGNGTVVFTAPADGTCARQGLSCGQSNGTANQCYSCTAHWAYPGGCGADVNCVCN